MGCRGCDPYTSDVILTGETIMTVEQLRADYDCYTCSEGNEHGDRQSALLQLMTALPIMLDLMEAAIVWRRDGCQISDGQAMLAIIARFDDSAG